MTAINGTTTYYVNSIFGDDENDGMSQDNAWKTLRKVNEKVFEPGDRIFFGANSHYTGQLKPQGSGCVIDGRPRPIVIDMYGEGNKPIIDGEGEFESTLYLYNVEYWEINNLEIVNKGAERTPGRKGVYVHIDAFGTASYIHLMNLYVHDVNGSLVKEEMGGGTGIGWRNEGKERRSRFDGLLIEGCYLLRCERNGIIGSGYTGSGYPSRERDWHPSLNVVIRKNLLEEIPGDGIVPVNCDGALVEYNVMRRCTRLLPDGEAAAGIWPWGCDNTVVQFNEVCDHKSPLDAQGFDSDWNCRNTIIQYNYSHDNEGGFLLICNNGGAGRDIAINTGTIARYNISVNDGLRATGKNAGFSPAFHISGPIKDTKIYNNVIYVPRKPNEVIDTTMIKMDNWGGPWPENTSFVNNIFYVEGETRYVWGESIAHKFEHNLFYGKHHDAPHDSHAIKKDPMFCSPESAKAGFDTLRGFMLKRGSPCIGTGTRVEDNGGRDFFGNPVGEDGPENVGASDQVV